jgi:hypothetical protein
MDKDLKALERALKSLRGSTSRRMLEANLTFLLDYFIWNPSRTLPTQLKPWKP